MFVERAYVSGAQPAVVKAVRRGVAEIGPSDPRAARFEFSDRLPVPGQDPVAVAYAQLNAGNDAAGLGDPLDLVSFGAAARRPRDGNDGAGFGQSPALDDLDSVPLEKTFGETSRHGGASAEHHAKAGAIDGVLVGVAECGAENRRDRSRNGGPQRADHPAQGL